jgi:glycosyltransferase involved in cell wall biosynthesis
MSGEATEGYQSRCNDLSVSVVMPAFNSEKYISEAIESVVNQTHSDLELIVVVDGGSDRTKFLVERFSKKDARVRLVVHEFNKGVAEARNTALKIATGRYIAFCDSDDIWLPNKLSIQLEIMRSNKAVLSHSSAYLIDERGRRTGVRKIPKHIDLKMMYWRNFIINSSGVIDSLFFSSIAQHDIRSEDYDMWFRLFIEGKVSVGSDDYLLKYRVHKLSLTPNLVKSIIWMIKVQRKNQRPWLRIFLGFFYNAASRIRLSPARQSDTEL